MRHGGKILVAALEAHGVERVFTVPGESFLPVLDALHDSPVHTVVCRHEGGAAMMAEADGKMTGRAGVAIVTRGPGACNASSGVHVARQDSTPMLLLVGQIARGDRDRDVFQEVDYRAMFAPLAKWAAEVEDTARLPEYLARAFHVAQSGRPGPVVLALPEDVLAGVADVADRAPVPPPPAPELKAEAAAVARKLARAERPVAIVGGSGWTAGAARGLGEVAAAWNLPVAAAFRRQDYLDNRHPCYAGDLGLAASPALLAALSEADLVLALGTRLGDVTTGGYTRLPEAARLIHVHPDPGELGKVLHTDLAIAAPAPALIAALATQPATPGPQQRPRELRAAYETWQEPRRDPGAVQMAEIVRWLSTQLSDDAIVTNGAGNYAAWVHRYFRFKAHRSQLAPTSGSMGYGLPAAIAAKLAHPGREVVAFAGDGCFQMTGAELATAVQHRAGVIVLVINNGQYGTIRMHQERTYPGRVSGTALVNPDFAALAASCGAWSGRVEETASFAAAFAAARMAAAEGQPALIELITDPAAIAPGLALSDISGA
ncbi:MAG: thiamine pyrophosphate-dependent enzyme [Pseudomonadota bacterium]